MNYKKYQSQSLNLLNNPHSINISDCFPESETYLLEKYQNQKDRWRQKGISLLKVKKKLMKNKISDPMEQQMLLKQSKKNQKVKQVQIENFEDIMTNMFSYWLPQKRESIIEVCKKSITQAIRQQTFRLKTPPKVNNFLKSKRFKSYQKYYKTIYSRQKPKQYQGFFHSKTMKNFYSKTFTSTQSQDNSKLKRIGSKLQIEQQHILSNVKEGMQKQSIKKLEKKLSLVYDKNKFKQSNNYKKQYGSIILI